MSAEPTSLGEVLQENYLVQQHTCIDPPVASKAARLATAAPLDAAPTCDDLQDQSQNVVLVQGGDALFADTVGLVQSQPCWFANVIE